MGRRQHYIFGAKVLPWLPTNPRLRSTLGEIGPLPALWEFENDGHPAMYTDVGASSASLFRPDGEKRDAKNARLFMSTTVAKQK